jgi:hypothetical protein
MSLTAKEIYERYNVEISPQKLGAFRAEQRRAAGPPFRMAIEYPPPILTPEEEAEALARAEYDDNLGNYEWEPGTYTILRAQNVEDAKAEAERIWHTVARGDDAIGYTIGSHDWRCVHSFYLDGRGEGGDNHAGKEIAIDDVRPG